MSLSVNWHEFPLSHLPCLYSVFLAYGCIICIMDISLPCGWVCCLECVEIVHQFFDTATTLGGPIKHLGQNHKRLPRNVSLLALEFALVMSFSNLSKPAEPTQAWWHQFSHRSQPITSSSFSSTFSLQMLQMQSSDSASTSATACVWQLGQRPSSLSLDRLRQLVVLQWILLS